MVVFPNCKINLGLNITEKRSDGFHNIETIFIPVSLHDIIEFSENKVGKSSKLINSGIQIDGNPEDNLIIKAYNIIKKQYDIPPVNIHIYKNIPFGAGLGGGSSDASFTLKALNELFELKISNKILIKYSKELGSDCAFFIENKPVFASGKGEIFSDIEINLENYYIVIIKPDIHIGTKEAYSKVIPQKQNVSIQEKIKYNILSWKNEIINDFEVSVFRKHPEIEQIKQKLYKAGAVYSSMSGSGSSVFGIFEKKIDPNLLFNKHKTFVTKIVGLKDV